MTSPRFPSVDSSGRLRTKHLPDAAATRTAISAPYGDGVTEIRVLTQAAYDAITTKSATTLYVIQG